MRGCFLQNLQLRVELSARGAEMTRLRTVSGIDLLWNGDPEFWPRHAPHLFPSVGRLAGDRFVHGGRAYPMPKHGFARDCDFRLARVSREFATFVLRDNEQTRAQYPFSFELRISYGLDGNTLHIIYEVLNHGTEPMPMALGAHPAFRWPLVPGIPKTSHVVKFQMPETAPIRRLTPEGFLRPEPLPTPVRERSLELSEDLFEQDAIIFDRLNSHRLRFEAPGTPIVQLDWKGFQHLGIWSKPDARFLCIEPWQGMASEAGYEGAFADRPGVVVVEPRSRRTFSMAITLYTDF